VEPRSPSFSVPLLALWAWPVGWADGRASTCRSSRSTSWRSTLVSGMSSARILDNFNSRHAAARASRPTLPAAAFNRWTPRPAFPSNFLQLPDITHLGRAVDSRDAYDNAAEDAASNLLREPLDLPEGLVLAVSGRSCTTLPVVAVLIVGRTAAVATASVLAVNSGVSIRLAAHRQRQGPHRQLRQPPWTIVLVQIHPCLR